VNPPVPPVPPRPDVWPGGADATSHLAVTAHPRGYAPPWSRLRERTAATWSLWVAIGLFLLGDLLIGQLLFAGVVIFAMHIQTLSTGAAGTPEIAVTIASDVGFLATIIVWLRLRVREWRAIFGIPARDRALKEILVGAICGPGIYLGVVLISAFVLAPAIGVFARHRSVESPSQIQSGLSAGGVALTVVLSVLVAPIVEETFFRGVLFRSVRDRRGFWLGALVSSVLFGLAHYVGAPWQDTILLQSTMMFTGLGLAALYEWRGNIVANIAAHMAFNTIGVILIFAIK
jgi:membrane protease YdiL (CAAX protease family)